MLPLPSASSPHIISQLPHRAGSTGFDKLAPKYVPHCIFLRTPLLITRFIELRLGFIRQVSQAHMGGDWETGTWMDGEADEMIPTAGPRCNTQKARLVDFAPQVSSATDGSERLAYIPMSDFRRRRVPPAPCPVGYEYMSTNHTSSACPQRLNKAVSPSTPNTHPLHVRDDGVRVIHDNDGRSTNERGKDGLLIKGQWCRPNSGARG